MQSDATTSAADTQAKSSQQAINEQARQYNLTRADMQPWRTSGNASLMALQRLLGTVGYNKDAAIAGPNGESLYGVGSLMLPFKPTDLQNEPGYQFGLKQGEDSINRAASAGGRLLSGATLKALNRYSQDYAGTKYNEAFNRDLAQKQNIYNMLSGQSGTGQVATQQIAAAGQNSANNIAELLTGQGNALAAGQVGSANAWGNAFSNIQNQYQQQQLMNRLFPSTSGGTGGSSSSGGSFFGFV